MNKTLTDNIKFISKDFSIKFSSIENDNKGNTIFRCESGVNKLEQLREYLILENIVNKPVSTHREDGGVECFMILWGY